MEEPIRCSQCGEALDLKVARYDENGKPCHPQCYVPIVPDEEEEE